MCLTYGPLQVIANHILCLIYLLLAYLEVCEGYMVELLLIASYGIITASSHIIDDGTYRIIELRHVKVRTLYDRLPCISGWVSYYSHNIIFSIGLTRMPCAPSSFSLPIISQKHFSSSTVCIEHQSLSANGITVGLFMPGSTFIMFSI